MIENLHLGLTPWHFADLSAPSLTRQAKLAESLGFQSIWLPENHFGANALPDPLTLLAAIAGATDTIKLGTTSYLLTLRNPLQAAEQVAVLDQLSQGRLILGVGRGYAPEMLKAFHVPPKEKRRIFAWSLELMRQAWVGERVSLDGDAESAIEVHPRPVQQPGPPIWVAAFGPKALAQAGRLGLPYLCSPMESMATLEANYAAHRQAGAEVEVDSPVVVPLMRTVYVSENAAELRAVKKALAEGSDSARLKNARPKNARLKEGETFEDWTIIGGAHEVQDKIALYQERLGMTHMIATRLRIPGMIAGLDEAAAQASMARLAELVVAM